ncbi:pre-rRNA processing [Kickxella alabastrina]|uniref:Pre-rRNA processing n=1 Tax=Kickxella alabastrina TaxID=61397 RepID=A0ACC1IPY2_9FUNG|nr:pre-rRNA processing [Kickxella alabastrina]
MTEIPATTALPATSHTDRFPAPVRRGRSSRFSVLLEGSVDYASYRAAYGRQFLQQQPKFDSLKDAEIELKCVLHDSTFTQQATDVSIMAENVALAVDWFISALVLLFDCDEPFQNPEFIQLCCMFFASPLYENNTRLVQRHLVKRAYAELNIGPEDSYKDTLWLLLAFLHLITEFQPDTHLLCKDSGLFPLLQRLAVGCSEHPNLQVLGMSLMFEIAQAVTLSQTDFACVTNESLQFLLEYIERMRYAESDVYNNTGTKLVLALNEQFLRQSGYASMPSSPVAMSNGCRDSQGVALQHRVLVDKLASARALGQPMAHLDASILSVPDERPPRRQLHIRPMSEILTSPSLAHEHEREFGDDDEYAGVAETAHALALLTAAPLRNPALRTLPLDSHLLSRSRSMDFRAQIKDKSHEFYSSGVQASEMNGVPSTVGVLRSKCKSSSSSPRQSAMRLFPASTPVVAILANRIDCCKTFTENLVFLLNRETDPATQVLILHMLNCILVDPSTAGILYTNDMHVLVDIILRDLSNLSEGVQRLRQAYILVVNALLRNPVYLAARHRLSDIELCMVNMLRQSLVCSQEPAGLAVVLRRGSTSSSATRHNSMTSDVIVPLDVRRSSRVASPVSSLSSSMSEDTFLQRPVDDPPVPGAAPKVSRRPAPPPPQRSRTVSSQSGSNATIPPAHSRRRAPPPPPPPVHAPKNLHPAPAEPSAVDHHARVHQRRPPPPPPPPRNFTQAAPSPKPSTPSRAPTPPPRTGISASSASVVGEKQRPAEQTGMRRQLSVKKSVSKYKRNSIRLAPPPPPRSRICSNGSSKMPVSPVIEVEDDVCSSVDDVDEDKDPQSLKSGFGDSVEGRRATRKLVESALRGCHEARVAATSRSPMC